MSNQNPNNPRRRRIAGERKPTRPATPETSEEVETPAAVETPRAAPESSGAGTGPVDGAGRGVAPLRVIIGLAVLALVLVATAAFLGLPALSTVRAANAAQQSAQSAPSVAERAATAILSYNYTSLDSDEQTAIPFMTDEYRKKYVDTFVLVRDNAPELRAKVVAEVSASGVSDASSERANVLVFVNQTTTSTANGGEPQVAQNRAMFEMVHQDGTWLVNNITSY